MPPAELPAAGHWLCGSDADLRRPPSWSSPHGAPTPRIAAAGLIRGCPGGNGSPPAGPRKRLPVHGDPSTPARTRPALPRRSAPTGPCKSFLLPPLQDPELPKAHNRQNRGRCQVAGGQEAGPPRAQGRRGEGLTGHPLLRPPLPSWWLWDLLRPRGGRPLVRPGPGRSTTLLAGAPTLPTPLCGPF